MKTNFRTRREFLRATTWGGALSSTAPAFFVNTVGALQSEAAEKGARKGKDSTILVVLQMAGGNDGVNTVVPYANDHYHRARRRLNLGRSDLLKIDDEVAFHATRSGFKELYDDGELGIVQGVGYPNPNRSHFRSTEIWQTASDSNKFEKHGWIGRYFDHACKGADQWSSGRPALFLRWRTKSWGEAICSHITGKKTPRFWPSCRMSPSVSG